MQTQKPTLAAEGATRVGPSESLDSFTDESPDFPLERKLAGRWDGRRLPR
jgi:hypothetical protein